MSVSLNTQAVLLLSAPLVAGGRSETHGFMTPGEYSRLARLLRNNNRQPADLLQPQHVELRRECQEFFGGERLTLLLSRGFQLSQALEHWQARSIWVLSRADSEYPTRLREHLGGQAPVLLYGCGDPGMLDVGGLAVVGSRSADANSIDYAEGVGELTARAHRVLISGGARGVDQAAMRAAARAGGKVLGVLADSMERAVLQRENRNLLLEEQLILVTQYDPAAGFNVGNAMNRNKLIYALSDAALVVSAELNKGGTWAGATEQLKKRFHKPVYIRSNSGSDRALSELGRRGAMPWPSPQSPESLATLLERDDADAEGPNCQPELRLVSDEERGTTIANAGAIHLSQTSGNSADAGTTTTPAEEILIKVAELLTKTSATRTDSEVATLLGVSRVQASDWLRRLVELGLVERLSRPARYRARPQQPSFLDEKTEPYK